jgi:tRNA nucleotidyltransferase (CCA-adding enzyme)
MRDGDELLIALPAPVAHVLGRLLEAGHEAALVGGGVRDAVRGEAPTDWDVATSAPPETVTGIFPDSVWENRFGTVTLHGGELGPPVEVTTYRVEGPYLDRRRPGSVSWGRSLEDDLSRRDFTINAMGWRPDDLAAGRGRLVDPHGGSADLAGGVLRAVGDPDRRIAEDALRMVRAVRFAARLGLRIDPATAAAIRRHAGSAASLSGERLRGELLRIMGSPAPPSIALGLMHELGLLGVVLPELAALRGVPQAKALPGDAFDHSLRTADALPADDPLLRLAGLLHDLGKATTLADGHFIGHDREGAGLAGVVMRRLRFGRAETARVERLVTQHMFAYTPNWTDAAVRRFIRRVGTDLLDDLYALRRADNVASGTAEPASGGLDELRRRAAAAIASDPLGARQLAVDGNDLVAELGLEPGPMVGRLLAELLEAVVDDPRLNARHVLLQRARHSLTLASAGAAVQRQPRNGVGEPE